MLTIRSQMEEFFLLSAVTIRTARKSKNFDWSRGKSVYVILKSIRAIRHK